MPQTICKSMPVCLHLCTFHYYRTLRGKGTPCPAASTGVSHNVFLLPILAKAIMIRSQVVCQLMGNWKHYM